ncbi:MAG: helix-turn-helix domain-containing protein [Lactobacillaceae bacterium]|nr:helix-turn-helix domain-containing protein [Lactobacillaceae bacterium]
MKNNNVANEEKNRKDNKISQFKLAKQLFVAQQTISEWENNSHYPDFVEIKRVFKILKISLSKLDD